MRVLMFSWEYPPKSVGGLARHVADLSTAMARQGIEVHVITQGDDGLPTEESHQGVMIHRVNPYSLWSQDFTSSILHLNMAFMERAGKLWQEIGGFQIVHSHDWLVAYVGRMVKHIYGVPLIATIHATEYGRHNGLHNDLQRYISQIEWWLCYEAWKVIVCSYHMEGEVSRVFQVPLDKIAIIPNGVEPEAFAANKVNPEFKREDFALDDERILLFVGRLVWEKGVQTLVEAMPRILSHYPEAKLVIAGTGPQQSYLRHLSYRLGISHKVCFAGYVDDATKVSLYRAAEAAVFPSLYEPFGIVALEAMAAETPVIVGQTGGLAEIVRHGENGQLSLPGNPNSLADQAIALLSQPSLRQRIVKNGLRDVLETYSWDSIAASTNHIYERVLKEKLDIDKNSKEKHVLDQHQRKGIF